MLGRVDHRNAKAKYLLDCIERSHQFLHPRFVGNEVHDASVRGLAHPRQTLQLVLDLFGEHLLNVVVDLVIDFEA